MDKLIFLLISLFILSACNNKNKTSSGKGDSIPHTENLSPKNGDSKDVDSFFLKIKGSKTAIVPGKAIGDLRVGESSDSLQNLGKPQKGDAGMCKSLNRWFYGDSGIQERKELGVFSECDPKDDMRPHVIWVRTTDPAFKTESGLGVHSSYKDIKALYPQLIPVASYTSSADSTKEMLIVAAKGKGISFEMPTQEGQPPEEGSCQAIVVYDPHEKMPSLYFSFYKDLKIF